MPEVLATRRTESPNPGVQALVPEVLSANPEDAHRLQKSVQMGENGKRLVVTGSSAGGIEALSKLLGSLTSDFSAPIVVAQHIDPRVESSLATILAKRTTLNVISILDHEDLQPGSIYVVPANQHVRIEDGHVALVSDGEARPKPSIDLLFATAAKAYGDRLIAIVLTGMGSDGAVGSRAVKERGGTVIVEDPSTASFPSMPASLPPSMVDIIAPVDQIGYELERLLSDTTTADDDSLALLLTRISETNGIDFSQYKMPTIKRRLARQMHSAGAKSLKEYLSILERTPSEYERLVATFLVKVTEFFRDPELFAWLKDHAISEFINEASAGQRELRFWSAGCATGEEAYSLAILVAEVLGDGLSAFNVRIFATDMDEAAIAFARRGVYPESALTNLSPDLVRRYFNRVDRMYEVSKLVRDMTVFGQHDLAQRAPFPRIDLVLCRNVLIYFNKDLQRRTLQIFAFSLRNGGYLALGKAEMSNPLPASFEPVNQALHVFRRYGERVSIPPAPPARPLPRSPYEQRARRRSISRDTERGGRKSENEEVGEFLMDSEVGFISISPRYNIAIINPPARRMLRIHGIAVGEDLIHLLPPESAARMRSVIDAALRSEQPQVGGEELQVPSDDEHDPRCLSISCYPKSSPKADGAAGAALLIVDVTELVEARRVLETETQALRETVAQLREHETQWKQNRLALLDANRQLLEANSDLRERNDALLIDSEEATAVTEEIETLNEEMQATNEELETLNEESQATIEELNTTNDELEARTTELQALIVARESQRQEVSDTSAALQTLIDAVSNPLAFVASGGEVVASNLGFRELRKSAGESTVHIDDDSNAAIAFPVLLRRAANGESFRISYQTIGVDQQRRRYLGKVTPSKTGNLSGALLMFEPIE